MSLETTILIGILTLLAIGLGADFCWNVLIKPIFLEINNRSFLKIVVNADQQTTLLVFAIFLLVVVGAIILNIIPNLRLESYLLKIGLVGLIFASSLTLIEFIQIDRAIFQELSTNSDILIWIRLLAEIVAYWSFLHYALNPQI